MRRLHLSLALTAAVAAAGAERIPTRTDLARPPRPDLATLLLWRFDQVEGGRVRAAPLPAQPGGAAPDSGGNLGRLMGKARSAAEGRFGHGLRVHGGGDGVVLTRIGGLSLPRVRSNEEQLSIDFWFRCAAAPKAAQCLLELPAEAGESAIRLDLESDGRLSLRGLGLKPGRSAEAVPAGRWVHVAIVPHVDYWPSGAGHSRIFVRGTGAAALVNGRLAVTALADGSYHEFPPRELRPALAFGNSAAFDAGFDGWLDELHVSRGQRSYYELPEQPWLDPEGRRPIAHAPEFFRGLPPPVFHESFEHDATLAALRASNPAADGGELRLEPGAKGKALVVRGFPGGARVDLPKGLSLRNGAIELLFKPGDWDNLTVGKRGATYEGSRLNLIALYGTPRDGKGGPRELMRAAIDRVRSAKCPPHFDLLPNRWAHAVLTWGEHLPYYQPHFYVDGGHTVWDIRHSVARVAKPEVWAACEPAFIRIGNAMETAYDAIRVYSQPWGAELVENALAELTGKPLERIPSILCTLGYRHSVGRMIVSLNCPLGVAAAGAKVAFRDPRSGRTVEGAVEQFDAGGSGAAELDVGRLAKGDYVCSGRVLEKASREVGRFEQSWRREPIPWLGNRIGIADTPPPPFTPVAVADGKATCIGRVYAAGPTGLLDAIRVNGREILASPMRWELTAGGRTLVPGPHGDVRFGACSKVEARWGGAAQAEGLRIESRVRLEYDGMARWRVVLRPTAGPVAIDALTLRIPLAGTVGRYLHALPLGGDFRNYEVTRCLPATDGPLWDSLSGFKGKPILKPTAGNFVPMVWLGGRVRGLCWFADSDQGWVPSDRKPAITITRHNDVVTLSLHFIAEPFVLRSPRTVVFGLLATPSKPLPADHRLWNRGRNEQVGLIGGPLTSCDAFRPWRVCPKDGAFDYWPRGHDWERAERCVATERTFRPHAALMLYTDKVWGPIAPRDASFAWEWKSGPRNPWCWTPSLVDAWVWHMDQWIGRGVYNGLYIDDAFPAPNVNTATGSAYVLDDGRVQPGVSMFGFRDYLKRLRSVFHAHGRRSLVTIHMTSTIMVPALSFADLIWDGEDSGRFRSTKWDFLDAWPLERFHTLNNPERTGLVTRFMFKSDYASLASRSAKHVYQAWRAAYAGRLLHDFVLKPRWEKVNGKPVTCLRVVDDYATADATFHPYWDNAAMATVEPVLDGPLPRDLLPRDGPRWTWSAEYLADLARNPLKASVWRRKGHALRALIVVVNFARVPVKGRLRLGLAALGVPEARRKLVRLRDADDWPRPDAALLGPRPKTPDAPALGELGDADPAALLDEPAADRSIPFDPQTGTATLTVPPHDFRLLEATWQEQ